MKAIVLGLIFLAAAVLAVIPPGLGWWADVLAFLRGALPVLAILIGMVALFIGIADIKDKAAAKKESPEEAA
jgi:type IV secretory pathway VirB2 component (pilin)